MTAEGITHVFVNWSEILRYRLTYGYTDYIFPQRFSALEDQGILSSPTIMSMGDWASRSPQERDEILSWNGGPQLIEGAGWKNLLLYRVVTVSSDDSELAVTTR